jgi:hypothetical protein
MLSVCVVPYPHSQAFHVPLCAGSPVELSTTPEVVVHGACSSNRFRILDCR